MHPFVAFTCIVLVFALGYYFGRVSVCGPTEDKPDPADWWKRGDPPPE